MPTSSQWPEADPLFRSDPRWLGSDDAYSIRLDDERTLWLFGDTFVTDEPGTRRAKADFINNSIGIMRGLDPTAATMTFHWRAGSRSFFEPADPETWLWPLHGALAGERLLLFFMVVRAAKRVPDPIERWRKLGPLSFFEVTGWSGVWVENPLDDPADWQVKRLDVPGDEPGICTGAGALVEGDHLLLYGWDLRTKQISLCRVDLEDAARADLSRREWWCGEAGWRRAGDARPVPVIEHGATELTVHRDAASGRLCQMQTTGVIDAAVAVRWADAPEGPWSPLTPVFTPEESHREDALVYAAKAHPHLLGADLVVTYASNAAVDVTLHDESLYYPRFARIGFEGGESADPDRR